MLRQIYVAGVNRKHLAQAADRCPFWLLSATLLRRRNGLPSWLQGFLRGRTIIWDPGTFSSEAISYHGYRSFLDRWARSKDEYLQYDEVGDPEATAWYLQDMKRRGYQPVPVLQPGGDIAILNEPRAALGGTVPMSAEVRQTYLDRLFYGPRPATGRIHLLGQSRHEVFERYPAVSGDSTTWIPRGPYNRTKTVDEWLALYGEHDIELISPRHLPQFLAL